MATKNSTRKPHHSLMTRTFPRQSEAQSTLDTWKPRSKAAKVAVDFSKLSDEKHYKILGLKPELAEKPVTSNRNPTAEFERTNMRILSSKTQGGAEEFK